MVEIKNGINHENILEENIRLKSVLEENYDKFLSIKGYLNMIYEDVHKEDYSNIEVQKITKSYEDKISIIEEQYSRKNKDIEGQIQKLIKEVNLQKKANDTLNNENLKYSYAVDRLEVENTILKDKLANNYEKLQDILTEVSVIKSISNKKFSENDILKKEILECKKRILVISNEMETTKEKNRQLTVKNKQLTDRLEAFRNSKLGKINRTYWSWCNSFRKKKQVVKENGNDN